MVEKLVSSARCRRLVAGVVTSGAVFGASGSLAGASAAALPPGCTQSGQIVTCSKTFTSGSNVFTVPAGVSSIHILAVGGMGAASPVGGGGGGGFGDAVSADLPVSALTTLYAVVAGNAAGQMGGANGGANGVASGGVGGDGGGGGASDVRTSANDLSSRLLVGAGGGGGGGTFQVGNLTLPGGGGGNAGVSGGAAGELGSTRGGAGGGPGSNTAGGPGGSGGASDHSFTLPSGQPVPDGCSGSDGTLGIGGTGGAGRSACIGGGGGGGGGLYGGGGGGAGGFGCLFPQFFNCVPDFVGFGGSGGGGGGSSLVPPGGSQSIDTTGIPLVQISYRLVPTSKDQCKNGGWLNFPQFKNQGDCVAFTQH